MRYVIFRNGHRRCSVKKSLLRNFAKFTGKHLRQSLFFKKENLAQVFSCEFYEIFTNIFYEQFYKILRTPFLQNTSGRLLLNLVVNLPLRKVIYIWYYFKNILKALDIMYVSTKEKKRVHNWRSNAISNFTYFYHKHLQFLWLMVFFILIDEWHLLFLNLFLVIFSIKLLDCPEENIQTKGQ